MDLDCLPMEVHGHQPGSAHNGHYHCRCFHPLVMSWEFGDFLGGKLREGNVHTSTDALDFVLPYLEWASALARRVWLRMDAGFPSAPFLNRLEEGSYRYVARLSSNPRLERMAWPHVDRIADKAEPEDRTHTVELSYQARPWSRETFRRLVLKAPGRVARSSRYVTLWVQERWALHWSRIGRALQHLPSARGSPSLQALPLPA